MTWYRKLLHREKIWALCRKRQECYSVACFIWESQTSFQILIRPQNSLWNQQIKQQRESHCLFFLFLSFSCILQSVTGRNVGRQIQKCIQMSLSITGVVHRVLQILFHLEATPCSVGLPAPTWCFPTFPVLCRAAFRGTGFQALGTSVETEIEADAIAKPPGSAEIIPHPRSSLCSSPTAAAQPPKSWFPTGMLHLGGCLCWEHPWLHPRALDKGEGDGQVSAWLW